MVQVNALGDACPIPVVKTKKAIGALTGPDVVETLVDNEIAVRNLTKLAKSLNCKVHSEKLDGKEYKVVIEVGEDAAGPDPNEETSCMAEPGSKRKTVVVIRSQTMGNGSEELGKALMKGFIYALSQLETLPTTILFYNGGAHWTCEESPSLEDLKSMEAQGVEILTCGTCLDFYQLSDKLQVGEVTNMYTIVEKMTQADRLIEP